MIFLAEGIASAVDSVASFARALRRGRLLEPAQLAELTGKILALFQEPRALAAELIRRGWLTPYQVNQLFQGRGDDLLLGSYVLLERLGEGGMGQVFKARNWKLRKVVAVKLIRKDRLAHPDAVRRFQREVRAAAQLNHPNVVHAIDTDEAGDRLFFVMEYVEGTDLAKLVRQHGPLPVARACDCARQAALALQHAFERGLVHRDIKPHNLLLAKAGAGPHPPGAPAEGDRVKILDMGLARLSQSAEQGESLDAVTREGTVLGTLDYIAPEQALDSRKADTRSDLYSLGCTLYFLLTGRPPFPGGTATEKLLKHQLDQPTPIEQLRPEVPAAVSAVVGRLMAKRPEQRYQTPAEAATALAAALSGASLPVAAADRVTASLPPEQPSAPAEPAVQSMTDTTADWSSIVSQPAAARTGSGSDLRRADRRRWLWFNIAGGVGLLVLAGLLVVLLRGRNPSTNTAPPDAKYETVKETEAQAFEKWVKKVAGQSPDWQIKAVAAKLKERNRGFDGTLKPAIDNEVIVGLEISGEHVTDLSPLRALTGLKRLRCASDAGLSPLADLAPLKDLPLISLDCHGTKVADLSPLKGVPLTALDCRSTPVRDLSLLGGMPLTSLTLENTRVADLSPLKGMRLVELRCGATEIADLSPLKGMPLITLSCSQTKVRDLSPLEGMPLVVLHCENTRVADLSPLKKLRLVELRCSNTDVASLAPLKDVPLERLSCANTRVADLSPLKGKRLVELNCAGTPVADLSPLRGMPLAWLHCGQTKVTDLSPLKGLPLRELACDFLPKRDEGVLRSLATLERINGQPAAEFWKGVKP